MAGVSIAISPVPPVDVGVGRHVDAAVRYAIAIAAT
jgi:hypothetical protein